MTPPQPQAEKSVFRADLEALMVRYQQADGAAASDFVTAVSPLLYKFFYHHTGNAEDAADLLQETWLRIHKSRDTYRTGEPILPWLFGIARHVQVDGYRSRLRIRLRERAVDALPDWRTSVNGHAEELPAFQTLIRPLPQGQREVVTMLKLTGMSLEEVAGATGSTVGAIKQKAHRAYETLRKLLVSQGKYLKQTPL